MSGMQPPKLLQALGVLASILFPSLCECGNTTQMISRPPTPELVRKSLSLDSIFAVDVTAVAVIVSGPRFRALYTHALKLVSASYFDSLEVS